MRISSLRDNIHSELWLLRPRPYFVSQAFELAQQIEAKRLIPKLYVANNPFFPPTMKDEADTVKSPEPKAAGRIVSAVVTPVLEVIENETVIINEVSPVLDPPIIVPTSPPPDTASPVELLLPNPVPCTKMGCSFVDRSIPGAIEPPPPQYLQQRHTGS